MAHVSTDFTLSLAPVPVTATAGVEWTPFSRADTTWVDDGRTSGTGVGEFDGTVRPQMAAFAGVWLAQRWGLSGGIGLAQLRQSTWSDEVFLHRHWAVLRPHMDVRYSFIDRDNDAPFHGWSLACTAHYLLRARYPTDFRKRRPRKLNATVKSSGPDSAGLVDGSERVLITGSYRQCGSGFNLQASGTGWFKKPLRPNS